MRLKTKTDDPHQVIIWLRRVEVPVGRRINLALKPAILSLQKKP